jgi:hypothetical protein
VTDAERQKALRRRREAQGLQQVPVWVPKGRADEIRAIAKAMCDDEAPPISDRATA